VKADLDTVRLHLGVKTATDDGILANDLEVATAWVADRVMPSVRDDPEVQLAVVLLTCRLYKRRQTPDGIAGWSADGVVARIVSTDPDIRGLLTRKRDMCQMGIG
jgi:hypothetical protein